MSNTTTIATADGLGLLYKDWGPKKAQPVMFRHGWPLSADDWDNQMLFFLSRGYRVIAHDLKNVIHVGHSTGRGEVIRDVARSKPGRSTASIARGQRSAKG